MPRAHQLKTGRVRPEHDSRDIPLYRYTKAQVPNTPAAVDYIKGVGVWGELGNADVGDCTEAGCGHQIQAWTKDAQGKEAKITTAETLQRYERLSGYVPGDESTDTGLDERTVLKDWLKNPFAGHTLAAFGKVALPDRSSISDILKFKTALWALGGVYLGLALPLSAQDQLDNGEAWDVTSGPDSAPNSWGGHAVACLAYDGDGLTVITWGRKQRLTYAFAAAYVDEAWGLVSTDWLHSGISPSGFDLAALEADVKAVRGIA